MLRSLAFGKLPPGERPKLLYSPLPAEYVHMHHYHSHSRWHSWRGAVSFGLWGWRGRGGLGRRRGSGDASSSLPPEGGGDTRSVGGGAWRQYGMGQAWLGAGDHGGGRRRIAGAGVLAALLIAADYLSDEFSMIELGARILHTVDDLPVTVYEVMGITRALLNEFVF